MAQPSFDRRFPGISLYDALTSSELSEKEKAKIIAEAIDSLAKEFPNLKNVATSQQLSETELTLTKEIKELDARLTQEIKELDARLTQEIKELDARLTKEMKELDTKLTKEIKELEVKIAQSKTDVIKWVGAMMIGQIIAISAIVGGMMKIFMH